jgi:hypothetical protein
MNENWVESMAMGAGNRFQPKMNLQALRTLKITLNRRAEAPANLKCRHWRGRCMANVGSAQRLDYCVKILETASIITWWLQGLRQCAGPGNGAMLLFWNCSAGRR